MRSLIRSALLGVALLAFGSPAQSQTGVCYWPYPTYADSYAGPNAVFRITWYNYNYTTATWASTPTTCLGTGFTYNTSGNINILDNHCNPVGNFTVQQATYNNATSQWVIYTGSGYADPSLSSITPTWETSPTYFEVWPEITQFFHVVTGRYAPAPDPPPAQDPPPANNYPPGDPRNPPPPCPDYAPTTGPGGPG